jgi:hypothetical protein
VLSGLTYMLCPIVMTMHGTLMGRRRRMLEQQFRIGDQTLLKAD